MIVMKNALKTHAEGTKRGVIFDLDGTLVDSLEDIAMAMTQTLNAYGFPGHALEAYRTFIGKGLLNLVKRALPTTVTNVDLIQEIYEGMLQNYSLACTKATRPYDGIIALLDELQTRQVPMAVFTNKAEDLAQKVVQDILPGYFTEIRGLVTEAYKKPNPHVALDIAQQLQIQPEDLLFVGDSEVDMQTATNAKMLGVGVSWGYRSEAQLAVSGAGFIVHHPGEIIPLLG